MKEPPFRIGSVKEQILQKVWRLGRSACRSLIFRARISTDETVDAGLRGLLREGYLTAGPGDLLELTAKGYEAIEQEPGAVPPKPVTEPSPERTKICRTCKQPKRLSEFGHAPRSADKRTMDCSECRSSGRRPQPEKPSDSWPRNVSQATAMLQAESPSSKQAVPSTETRQLNAETVTFTLPAIEGVYARIEGDRVFISQPCAHGCDPRPIRINRERGLELGRFLVEHLGER